MLKILAIGLQVLDCDATKNQRHKTNMELKLTTTIHHEIKACASKMISWMTAVVGMAFAGVFYVARYLPA